MLSITNQSKLKIVILIVFAALTLFLTACNSQAEKLNLDGNEAFSEQAYLDALELYQSAQIESPELAEPYYNAGNALYRQGDYPTALEQMQMALQYIDEVTLAESSFFNMGNTLFNSQDPGTAIEAYKQALLLDPDDLDAKYNLELALQQQQEQQEQEQQQQEQEQDQGEQEENQDQSGEDSESDSEQSNDEGQEQGEDEEESDNGENQDDQTQEGDQSEKDDQGDGDQEQDQENAGGQPQEGEDQQEGEQPSQAPAPGQRMTEEQAKQLLAAIANDMQTLQERLGQLLFSRKLPPAQDW